MLVKFRGKKGTKLCKIANASTLISIQGQNYSKPPLVGFTFPEINCISHNHILHESLNDKYFEF